METHTHAVEARTPVGTMIWTHLTATIISVPALVTLTGAIDALPMMTAFVWALVNGAIVARPVVIAQTCSVNTFPILMTITWTNTDATVGASKVLCAMTFTIHAHPMHVAVIGANVRHSKHGTIRPIVTRAALASTVSAFAIPAAIVRAMPWRHIAILSAELSIAGTHPIDTRAMIGTHVLADTLVLVFTAVRTGEPGVTTTHLRDRVTVSVVGATVWTDLDLTSLASERWRAEAPSLKTRSNTRTLLGALTDVAKLTSVPWLTQARPV